MASRFWVGGTGTWDSTTTTHWATGSGLGGGASAPGSADTAVFDAASGGGTVTVDTTINGLSFLGITMGAFTGTLDFSVNNPSITLTNGGGGQFSITGSGVRTLKMGTGTFTFSSPGNTQTCFDAGTTTNLTFQGGSATYNITFSGGSTGGAVVFNGGGLTFGTLNIGARSVGTPLQIVGANTFAALNITGPINVLFSSATTTTITAAISWNGSSSSPLNLRSSSNGGVATLAVAVGSVISWASLTVLAFTGTTVIATNSFDGLGNTGVTITGPTGGGVVGVIGS